MKPSTDNVFNWNTGEPSIFALDPSILQATTFMKTKASGRKHGATTSDNSVPIYNITSRKKEKKLK